MPHSSTSFLVCSMPYTSVRKDDGTESARRRPHPIAKTRAARGPAPLRAGRAVTRSVVQPMTGLSEIDRRFFFPNGGIRI
ncbi:hypothetical protein SDC9_69472 [bioreactor metagenome]|uniref:Uncharacterized protein n=1 Tax=bioreactor metagenome TaxID=1076179 RepID=A0A644Y390_9ZZZZ